jgi:hypothetical protein
VAGTRVRVGVGVAVSVAVGVGVCVGTGVKVGTGVTLGVGVLVRVGVGVGVIDGVGDGVRDGTSTRTGISLATACILLIATAGWNLANAPRTLGPTTSTNAAARTTPVTAKKGRTQSCLRASPQAGQTSSPRLLMLPQCWQRTCRGCRWGLPQ